MEQYVEYLEFEKVQCIKEKLIVFEDYQVKFMVVSIIIWDVDVFFVAFEEKEAFVNYIKVVNGVIIYMYIQELVKNLDDDDEVGLL